MYSRNFCFGLLASFLAATSVSASVFLPYDVKATSLGGSKLTGSHQKNDFAQRKQLTRLRQSCSTNGAAMAIPGYGVAEQVVIGGFSNFLSIFNIVITARVLLSWFPQAQEVALLQPVFQVSDPYLNLFRGLIPPIFGLDLSPLLAFLLLSAMTQATAAVGAELTPEMKKKMKNHNPFGKKQKKAFGN
jgi:uncharacterized protein YggT (Ycf19 family)